MSEPIDYDDLCKQLEMMPLPHHLGGGLVKQAAAIIREQLAERECLILDYQKEHRRAEKAEADNAVLRAERDAAQQVVRCFMGDFDVFDLSDEDYDSIERRARELWDVQTRAEKAEAERDALQAFKSAVEEIESLFDLNGEYLDPTLRGIDAALAAKEKT